MVLLPINIMNFSVDNRLKLESVEENYCKHR